MNGFLGKDGFAWFFGVVEDRKDPLKIGRVRVRILGFHSDDKNILPTKELPWATPIQGITSAAIGGKGSTPTGLLEGTWVLGFFTDPGSYQIPMVLGSIAGLNSKSIKKLGETPGNAFKDLRTQSELNSAPVDEFKTREYPDGKGKDGDTHGAQIENSEINTPNPKKAYSSNSTQSEEGVPDTNILGINDTSRLDNTPVSIKNASREKGGTRDLSVPVADINFDKFSTGIINQSGANRGTNKGLGVGYNGVDSSSKPSLKQNYKQFKDKPTNANGTTVFGTGTKTASSTGSRGTYSPLTMTNTVSSYKSNMNNVISFANSLKEEIKSQTEKTVNKTNVQRQQRNNESSKLASIGSYVPTNVETTTPTDQERIDQERLNKLKNKAEDGIKQQVEQTENNIPQLINQQINENGIPTINNKPIVVDNVGNISIDNKNVPIIDVTEKLKNQYNQENVNRNKECGDCGCQGDDCK